MPLSSYSGFKTTGLGGSGLSGSTSTNSTIDLETSQGLLNLALQQGGAVGQVAEELVHPTKGILSSIGNGFKKAFSGFVDLISIPNQAVAGVLSSKYSISEAIDKNISTSDVIFGDQNPNNTTMQKVGSFLVRTATDILLDPLTYVTFGASKGVLGLSGLQKVQVGEKAATTLGKDVFSKVALSETTGEGLYRFLNAQAKGTAKAEELFLGLTKQGGEVEKVAKAAKTELESLLLKNTLDAPLNMDFAKRAITNMLETNPAFAETILDKGGIKILGRSILSGQRISSTLKMIPGMTLLDNATEPFRLALQAPFDSTIRKSTATGEYVRLPEEFVEKQRLMQTMFEARRDEAFKNLDSIVKKNDLTVDEAKSISNNLLTGTLPADDRLANVYKQALGFSENEYQWLKESGKDIARKDLFGMPLVRTDVQNISFNPKSASISKKAGASFERTTGKFVNPITGEIRIGTPEALGLIKKNTAEEIQKITQTAEKNIESKGMKIESITKEIQKLHSFVSEVAQGKTIGEFSKLIESLPITDRENARQFINVLKDQMPKMDIEQLTNTFAKNSMEEGVKIKEIITSAVDKMSPETLERLKGKIASGELKLPGNIEDVNTALKEATPNINKSKTVSSVAESEDEIAQLAKKLKLESSARRFSKIGQEIDQEALFKFVDTIQQQFMANPTGVRKILNQIIGNKQQIIDLTNEIDLERTIAKQNISELPITKEFFVDTQNPEKLFEKFAATMDELKSAGLNFEDNFVIANAIRAEENARVGASTRFIRDVTESMGALKSEAPVGWRPLNMKNVSDQAEKLLALSGKNGEEIYFHPMIAQELESGVKAIIGDNASRDFFKVYDKVQNLWKAGVTSIFPAFHGRNALSNVFQNFLDIGLHAINPATHGSATQMIAYDKQLNALEKVAYGGAKGSEEAITKMNDLLNKKMFTDVSGYDWTVGEIRQVLKEKGIAFRGGTGQIDVFDPSSVNEFTDTLFGVQTTAGKVKKIAKTILPTSQEFALFKAGRELGSMVEDQAKLVNFMTNLRATGDVSHAAARTSMFLFDYQNLTPFEKTFLKRLIPFYTFTRKNLELQVKTLMSTPGRISAELTGLRNIGEAMSGGTLTDEEKANLPKWMQSGIGILKSRKGSTLEMFSSLGTPIEQPFAAFQPNQFLGSVSPLIRVPIETATGYSWFQGKALSDATNAAAYKNAPKALKDLIGYTELTGKRKDGSEFKWSVSLRPEMMNIVNNLPLFGRVLSSLKQMEDVDVSTQGKILQQLIGVKVYSINTEDEANKREIELEKKLKELLTKAGVTAQFTRTYIPKE